MTNGQLFQYIAAAQTAQGTAVSWTIKAQVTAVSATDVEWKRVDVLGGTGPVADAPLRGNIAKSAFDLYRKMGRIVLL